MTSAITDLWGFRTDDVWATGVSGVDQRWSGSAWVSGDNDSYFDGAALFAASTGEIFKAGSLALRRWWPVSNAWGDASSRAPYGTVDVWGNSAADVWAVINSNLSHFDGTTWASVTSGAPTTLKAIWGSGPFDVWAVGRAGTLVHRVTSWSVVSSPTSNDLNALWGSAANDIWAVGASGTIVHFNGSTWSSVASGTTTTLTAIHGALTLGVGLGRLLSAHRMVDYRTT